MGSETPLVTCVPGAQPRQDLRCGARTSKHKSCSARLRRLERPLGPWFSRPELPSATERPAHQSRPASCRTQQTAPSASRESRGRGRAGWKGAGVLESPESVQGQGSEVGKHRCRAVLPGHLLFQVRCPGPGKESEVRGHRGKGALHSRWAGPDRSTATCSLGVPGAELPAPCTRPGRWPLAWC